MKRLTVVLVFTALLLAFGCGPALAPGTHRVAGIEVYPAVQYLPPALWPLAPDTGAVALVLSGGRVCLVPAARAPVVGRRLACDWALGL